jgi:hypothetical protein
MESFSSWMLQGLFMYTLIWGNPTKSSRIRISQESEASDGYHQNGRLHVGETCREPPALMLSPCARWHSLVGTKFAACWRYACVVSETGKCWAFRYSALKSL